VEEKYSTEQSMTKKELLSVIQTLLEPIFHQLLYRLNMNQQPDTPVMTMIE
ncbi:14120_t:CDS:1, partial [Entrophospora sp. SA101]